MKIMKTKLTEVENEVSDGSPFDAVADIPEVEDSFIEEEAPVEGFIKTGNPEYDRLGALIMERDRLRGPNWERDQFLEQEKERKAALMAGGSAETNPETPAEGIDPEAPVVDGTAGGEGGDGTSSAEEAQPTAELDGPASAHKVDMDKKEQPKPRPQMSHGGGGGGGAIGALLGGLTNAAASILTVPTNAAAGGARKLNGVYRDRIFNHLNNTFVSNLDGFKKANAELSTQVADFNDSFSKTSAGLALSRIAEGNKTTLKEYLAGLTNGKIVDPVAVSLRDAALGSPEVADKWQAVEASAKRISETGDTATRSLQKLDRSFSDRFDVDKAADQLGKAAKDAADNAVDALGGEEQKKLAETIKAAIESVKNAVMAIVEKVVHTFKR